MRISWNLATVLLLVALVIGVFTMRRFNYGTLAKGQTALEREQRRIDEDLGRIRKILSGDEDNLRRTSAVIHSAAALPELLDAIQLELGAVVGRSGEMSRTTAELLRRVAALEQYIAADNLSDANLTSAQAFLDAATELPTEPLELPPELRARADELSAQATALQGFEAFLSHARSTGLIPEDVSPETHARLLRLYSSYKLTVDLVNFEERLHVKELAENAADIGDYLAVPLEGNKLGEVHLEARGILHVQRLEEEGVQRAFRFPLEEYPEFREYQVERENARDHLVRDVASLTALAAESGE